MSAVVELGTSFEFLGGLVRGSCRLPWSVVSGGDVLVSWSLWNEVWA